MESIGEDHVALKRRVAELEQQLAAERAARKRAEQVLGEALKANSEGQTEAVRLAEYATASEVVLANRIAAAEAQRDSSIARAEQAETDLESTSHCLEQQRLRAEEAERERDEWRQRALNRDLEITILTARVDRAEADNAALLAMLDNAETIHATGCDGMPCECGALAVREADHPGAALLERLRALEEVAVTLEPMLSRIHSFRNRGDGSSLFLARDEEPGPEVMDATALERLQNISDALEKTSCDECGMVGMHTLQCGRRG